VIPARLASTRLPRKLLLTETGKTLLQHTYEAACQSKKPAGVCIAADHEEIAIAARSFGARVIMTSPTCASGTDRLAEVAPQLADADLIVNVQGDEPELRGETIDAAISLLEETPDAPMATLCTPIHDREKLNDPSCVKVVFRTSSANGTLRDPAKKDASKDTTQKFGTIVQVSNKAETLLSKGEAIYFSRATIPYPRDWNDALLTAEPANFYQHLGLYVYRRDFLPRYAAMTRTPLEKLENLEQLRVIENGFTIMIGVIDEPTVGIDTPEDYREFVARWKKNHG
jgi:3-deoxy-manno-octulosonate cytidylyltransferase (CMP-KDO synthetase)